MAEASEQHSDRWAVLRSASQCFAVLPALRVSRSLSSAASALRNTGHIYRPLRFVNIGGRGRVWLDWQRFAQKSWCIMSVLDQHNRSLSVAEANEIAVQESEGRLRIVEIHGEVFAVYRRFDRCADIDASIDTSEQTSDLAGLPAPLDAVRRIRVSHLSLTVWGVFEMARAAGPRPERMVHGRAKRSFAAQFA